MCLEALPRCCPTASSIWVAGAGVGGKEHELHLCPQWRQNLGLLLPLPCTPGDQGPDSTVLGWDKEKEGLSELADYILSSQSRGGVRLCHRPLPPWCHFWVGLTALLNGNLIHCFVPQPLTTPGLPEVWRKPTQEPHLGFSSHTGQRGPLPGDRGVTATAPLASDTLVQPAKDHS